MIFKNVSVFSYSQPTFFSFIKLYLRPWPQDLSHLYHAPAKTVPSLSSDQRRDWRIDLTLGKRALYCLIFSMADTLSNSPFPSHSSCFLCTPLPQARRVGTDPKPLGVGWNLCPFGSGALLALAEIILSPFTFSPRSGVGLEVGSNSIAAGFHSSHPDHPAFTPKTPFPTDQISLLCWGKEVFCF